VRELDLVDATAYVTELAWTIACAEHDSMVLAQLTKDLELPLPEAGLVLRGLRNNRRPTLAAATAPLEFTPIVSHRDFRPVVQGKLGERTWGWELSDARQHCQQVLEVAVGVQLDALYRVHLRSGIGLDDKQARQVVAHLAAHMPAFS
jgi:hypothetical protein